MLELNLQRDLNRWARIVAHWDKSKQRAWVNYARFVKYLNINPHSKPVMLFIMTLAALLVSSTSVYLVKLANLVKPKALRLLDRLKFNKSVSKLSPLRVSGGQSVGTRVIHVPYKDKHLRVELATPMSNLDKYEHDRLVFKRFMKENERMLIQRTTPSDQRYHSAIKFQFFEKLYIIWNHILIPTMMDKNAYLLGTQIGFLIARTWLTLLVTKLDGQIMKDLMSFNIRHFLRNIVYWFLFAIPASYVNAGIKFLSRRLSLNFRTNLVRYCHDLYMDSRMAYYKLQFNHNDLKEYQLDHETFDQYITEDIKKFCDSLTNLFTNVGKPTVDLVFFAFYLRDNIGSLGIVGILSNYLITGLFLRNWSPNFSKIWKVRTFLEGIYYNYNLNLINNCEEISFYKGIKIERLKVNDIYNKLTRHLKFEIDQKFNFQLIEDYILKSVWPACGYLFAGLPIIMDSGNTLHDAVSSSSNIKSFIVNKRLILSMADAGSRLMYSIKDISRLNGITDRIFTLLVNLHQSHDSAFQYGFSDPSGNKLTGGFGSNYHMTSFASRTKLRPSSGGPMFQLGTIQRNYQGLRIEHSNIIPPNIKGPNGQPLLVDVNMNILKGQNLIIHGKNGSGKTSIIRLISELWPLYGNGLLSKPSNNDIMYVSQKAYFVSGTLRDQIIYPLNWKECVERGVNDDRIVEILKECGLDYLLERFDLDHNPCGDPNNGFKGRVIEEIVSNDHTVDIRESYIPGGVEGKPNWEKLLSGGERQKMIFARVLFHNKKFVMLDEPTSAISYDYEDILFELLKEKGITLVTISNRSSLIKYHDWILELKEDRTTQFHKVDDELLNKFEDEETEIKYLREELAKIEAMKLRKQELQSLLDGIEVM